MSTQWGDSTLHNTDDSLLTSSPSLLAQDNVGKHIDQNTWYFAPRADNNIDFNNMNSTNSKRNNGYAAAASRHLNPNTTDSFQILQTVQSRLLRHTRILESDIVRFLKENNMSDQIQSLYVNHQSTSATITITSTLAMANFLNIDCVLRGCRIEWTPHTAPFVDVSLMTLPTEMPDDIPLRILNEYYGKVISSRRRRKECLGVHYESLTRIYRMELKKPIPPTIRIAGFPTDVIYTGQPGREKPLRKNVYDNNFPNLPSSSSKPTSKPIEETSDDETQPPAKKVNLYVGNLPTSITEDELRQLFSVVERNDCVIEILKTSDNVPNGCAILTVDENHVENYLTSNGTEFYGKPLIVETNRPKPVSDDVWVDNVQPEQSTLKTKEPMTKTERRKRNKAKNGNISYSAELLKPAKTKITDREEGEISSHSDNESEQPMEVSPSTDSAPVQQQQSTNVTKSDIASQSDSQLSQSTSKRSSKKQENVLKDQLMAKLYNEKDIDIPSEAIESEFLSFKAHAIFLKFKGDVDKAKKEGFATSMISVMETLKSTSCNEQHLKQGLHNYAESLSQRMNNAST